MSERFKIGQEGSGIGPDDFRKKYFFLIEHRFFSVCYQDSKIYGVFSQFLDRLNPPPTTI